jgi:hypothetical protein
LLRQFRRDATLAQVSQDTHLSKSLVLQARGRVTFGETAVVQVAGFLQFREDGIYVLLVPGAAAKLLPQLARGMRASSQGTQRNT